MKIFAITTFNLCLICVLLLKVESLRKMATKEVSPLHAHKSHMTPEKFLYMPCAKTWKDRKSILPFPSTNALPTIR